MSGAFWDPFAPNEQFEALRFPRVETPAPVAPPPAGEEADLCGEEGLPAVDAALPWVDTNGPWPPMAALTPAEDVAFEDEDAHAGADEAPLPAVEEPLLVPPLAPPEVPWPAVTPAMGFVLVGAPYDPPAPEVWPHHPATAAADEVVAEPPPREPAPLFDAPLSAPAEAAGFDAATLADEVPAELAPEELIYLPGEKPPTLMDITAPRLRVSRGLALALGLHAAVLGTALWLMRPRPIPPPPDGEVVALVMETTPQGNTAAPVPVPPVAPPVPTKPAPPAPLPPPPAPPVPVTIKPADLPLPVPPAPPVPAAPAKAAPPLLVQGSKAPAQRVGAEMVTTNRPAAPNVGNPPPFYPPVARGLGEEGQVDLSVEVLPSGVVGGVVVAKSSGYPRLDEAARQSLLTWRFHAALKNGVPVASVFTYYVRYQLQ